MSGFDWNDNGRRDMGDSYMDYEIMNEKHKDEEGDGCCGCLCLIVIALILQSFIW